MSDTTTITPEERAELRELADKSYLLPLDEDEVPSVGFDGLTDERIAYIAAACNSVPRILDALEQAEAQLAAALQVNAARQAEVTADVLNAMMAGITGQKESVRVEVEGFQCPYCNEISKTIEAATAHDAICPKHPAVIRAEALERDLNRVKAAGIESMRRTEQAEASADNAEAQRKKNLAHCKFEFDRAEKAEAEVARLTKMVDWLADKVGDAYGKPCDKDLTFTNGECPMGHIFGDDCCIQNCKYTCWVAEAARRAVAENEVKG